MSFLNKELKQFVKSYDTSKGLRWKVIIPDGHGNQIRRQSFLNEASAVSFAREKYKGILLQTNKIGLEQFSKITFGEYSQQWLEYKSKNDITEVTSARYKDQIRYFLNPFFSRFKLNELQKYHLKNYITEMQNTGVSSYNIRSTVILFKMIIKKAIEDDLVESGRILTVKNPKHAAKDPAFWDQMEMNFFLNAVRESPRFNLWKFILFTGLRGGEIAALKWDCIFLNMKSGNHTGFIKVRRVCTQKTKKIIETTKNGETRMIPIFPQLRELILEMQNRRKGEFVFGGENPLDPSHFSRLLKQDLKKIPNLKRITCHGLRHTFCSYLDSTGMARRMVSEIMGHKDLNTTNRYSHVSNTALGNEVARWSENQIQQNSSNMLESVI